jgi:leader peptidase (prepilin peptidase)/N-methyltransferase
LGPPAWTLEVIAAASLAALVLAGIRGLPLIAYAWWMGFSVALAFVDLAVQRLPARLSYAAAGGLVVVLLFDALFNHSWHAWSRAVLGAAATAAVVGLCALAMPALVHWGDVRYALAVGAAAAWSGWLALYAALFLAALSTALVGTYLLVTGRAKLTTHLPQGPFWYTGTLVAVVLIHVGSGSP